MTLFEHWGLTDLAPQIYLQHLSTLLHPFCFVLVLKLVTLWVLLLIPKELDLYRYHPVLALGTLGIKDFFFQILFIYS